MKTILKIYIPLSNRIPVYIGNGVGNPKHTGGAKEGGRKLPEKFHRIWLQ